jgi:hypothetical protein
MKAKDNGTNNNETEQLHLTNRFTSAIEYARILHIERRKGTDVPYIAHLLGVASLVMGEVGHAGFPVTEDMVIAALLHDAAEDQGGSCGSRTSSTISARTWRAWSRDCQIALLRTPTTRNPGRSARRPISEGFAKNQPMSGSSRLLTSSTTQEQSSKTTGRSDHEFGSDSSVAGRTRSGISMNS